MTGARPKRRLTDHEIQHLQQALVRVSAETRVKMRREEQRKLTQQIMGLVPLEPDENGPQA